MKAQSALEYLMTYGWAILIVIIVGAALYALGVFNPGTFTGHKSTGFSATQMKDFKFADNDNLTLQIGNRYGRTIKVWQVNATYSGFTKTTSTFTKRQGQTDIACSAPCSLGPNEDLKGVVVFSPDVDATQGASYSIPLNIKYEDPETVTNHTDIGTVSGSVEPA